jgi:hypothetical protein
MCVFWFLLKIVDLSIKINYEFIFLALSASTLFSFQCTAHTVCFNLRFAFKQSLALSLHASTDYRMYFRILQKQFKTVPIYPIC